MRELHGYHGEHRRHARNASADAHVARAYDGPNHAVRDSLKLKMLLDPEARKAESLRYQKVVQEYQAKHTAGQLKPQEANPEHAPLEVRDKPTSAISKRAIPEHKEALRQPKPERTRLPSNEATQFAVSIGGLASSVADAFNLIPARAEGIAAGALAAVVAGVAWGNKRWKDGHGDRPKD